MHGFVVNTKHWIGVKFVEYYMEITVKGAHQERKDEAWSQI